MEHELVLGSARCDLQFTLLTSSFFVDEEADVNMSMSFICRTDFESN